MEKPKINRVTLQAIAQQILDQLEQQEFLSSDACRGGVNWPYALCDVYESLLSRIEPTD